MPPRLGHFTFVLHTHLPYVLHHGTWPNGSAWLTEAVSECYIPILGMLQQLEKNNVRAKISMDFSPILLEQIADPDFAKTFVEYCNEKIHLAEADYDDFFRQGETELRPLALFWHSFYTECKRAFLHDYHSDLIAAFKHFSDAGILDAMTCGATHGYFPLLLDDRNIKGQLQVAIATHEKYFGKKPRGIWLPECGYRPHYIWSPFMGPKRFQEMSTERAGVEELLSECGLEYFVVEGTLTKGGAPMRSYFQLFDSIHDEMERHLEWNRLLVYYHEKGDRSLSDIYAARSTYHELPGGTPLVFSRDRKTSEQVWSGEIGYPGNKQYLDFHKKHHNSGLRYWAVTGAKIDMGKKVLYEPESVAIELEANARHFVKLVKNTLAEHKKKYGHKGIVCSPFDTELFGHWWFEGPRFLAKVLELLDGDPDVSVTNCESAVDDGVGSREVISMPEGSWGEGGGHYVWTNREVAWTWDLIYPREERFLQLITQFGKSPENTFLKEVLTQAARELLLMEASDWQFNITTKGSPDYSRERIHEHADKLTLLLDLADRTLKGITPDESDEELLVQTYENDKPFTEIDLNWWA